MTTREEHIQTSPVSEIIAEAVSFYKDMNRTTIAMPVRLGWLRTTLNRVASVAREAGFREGAETARHNLLQELKPSFARNEEFYKDGAHAMKAKILAALRVQYTEWDGPHVNEAIQLITDLK